MWTSTLLCKLRYFVGTCNRGLPLVIVLSYTGNHCKGKMPSLMQSRTGWHRYPEKQPGR
eukprot:COSAG01_NODE_14571_length_1436_cov_61.955123_1_plen_58_part_10